jgi:diacylglycerol O-acyltransferase-1
MRTVTHLMQYYWRTWNLPVHFWLVRHVYAPIRANNGSKAMVCGGALCCCDVRQQASFVVFLLSAVAHEVLIAVPCHIPVERALSCDER